MTNQHGQRHGYNHHRRHGATSALATEWGDARPGDEMEWAVDPTLAPLPPGFTYAVESTAPRRKYELVVPSTQRRWQDATLQAPQPADQQIIDLYPQRRRVRVRRRAPNRRKGWLLLLILLIGGLIGGGAYWLRLQQQAAVAIPGEMAADGSHAALPPIDNAAVDNAALGNAAVDNAATGNAATDDAVAALRTSDSAVIAKAVVKPLRAATLGLTIAGRVQAVLVREGDVVTAGQPLLRLDDTRQLVAIAQARAGLQQAEAELLQVEAGARSEEIAAAQAVVDGAQARIDLLEQNNLQVADEAAAVAEVAAAEAQLQQLYAGPSEETLISARAAMRKAEALVATAQAAYDAVSWRNDLAMLPESAQLQQATIDFEAAQATYAELTRGADAAQISSALATIETARATLARVRRPVEAGEIDAAHAELRQAQAQLDLLRAGASTGAVSAAQAAVTSAQATLMEAEFALTETSLTAPFVGTVAALDVEVGEQVAPGETIVQLGDFSTWQLETDDLVELDIVRVKPGALVAITVDALPNAELRGRVVRVKPMGENKVGDMTYTVYITLEEQVAELAWNMTATVYIGGN